MSKVQEVRAVLNDWAECFSAEVVEQDHNLGLARSIVSGVTELCRRYGTVIVIEDDLIVGSDFLHYMIESLKKYENDDKVMQVGGFTISKPEGLLSDVFLLPVTTSWGWATWEKAWQHFSWEPKDYNFAQQDSAWRSRFNLNNTCSFIDMLEDRLEGRNDSWAILWWYSVSRQRGLVSYPKESLVWNGGFDGSGVHCGKTDFSGQKRPEFSGDEEPLKSFIFPPETVYEPKHLKQLERYFRGQSSNKLPEKFFRQVYNGFMRFFKKHTGKV